MATIMIALAVFDFFGDHFFTEGRVKRRAVIIIEIIADII